MSYIAKELHSLIHSMTPSEKKGLTMQHNNSGKPVSNSMVLFNALKKLKKYDEVKLKKDLRKIGRIKLANNLSKEMTILARLVLKAIEVDDRPIEKKLMIDFSHVKLLHERGASFRSLRKLKKLKKDAEIYDQKELLLQVYRFERETRRLNKEHKYLDNIEELNKKETKLLEAIVLEQKLRHIFDKVFYLVQKFGMLRKDSENKLLAEVEAVLRKVDREQCNCFSTQMLYLGSMEMLHMLKSETDIAFKYMTELYQLFEKHTAIRDYDGVKYIKFLNNYLNYFIIHNKSTDEFSEIVVEMKKVKLRTHEEEVTRFTDIFYIEFRYYLNQGDFEKLEKTLPSLLEGLGKYGDKIKLSDKTAIWYNIMIYYFLKEDFDAANSWIEEVQNNGDKSKRLDLLNNSRLFELLINYELGKIQESDNAKYLEYLIRTIKRNFKDADNSNALVNLITQMMTAHCNKAHLIKKDFNVALKKFKDIDRSQNINLPYDEIWIWLKSKVHRLSMQKIVEQMLRSK